MTGSRGLLLMMSPSKTQCVTKVTLGVGRLPCVVK